MPNLKEVHIFREKGVLTLLLSVQNLKEQAQIFREKGVLILLLSVPNFKEQVQIFRKKGRCGTKPALIIGKKFEKKLRVKSKNVMPCLLYIVCSYTGREGTLGCL